MASQMWLGLSQLSLPVPLFMSQGLPEFLS